MDFESLCKMLTAAESIVVFGHMNPDGDSIGATLAAGIILEKMGKRNVRLYSRDGIPDFLKFLPGAGRLLDRNAAAGAPPAQLALLVDCGGPKRIGDEFISLFNSCGKTAVIDHHATNSGFGDLNITDPDASSTCEIITLFAIESGIHIDTPLAECLYTGIMYDTGRFMHPNTSSKVFHLCAELVQHGADPGRIATEVFRNRSIAYLRLLGYALDNLKTEENGAICWTVIERRIFHKLNAKDEDSEGIVEKLGAYRGCEAHIVFGQTDDGRTRVSMRSTGRVNVGAICAKLGGGGHDFAAGLRSKDPLEVVIPRVLAETRAVIKELK